MSMTADIGSVIRISEPGLPGSSAWLPATLSGNEIPPMRTDGNPPASDEFAGLHIPVLRQEVCDFLAPADADTIVDATFGAGGYSRALLAAAPCRVIGIDRDPRAAEIAVKLQAEAGERFQFISGRFGSLDTLLAQAGITQVNGIVFDIGVSSMQVDDAARGFSFHKDGPLIMRMDAVIPGDAAAGGETAETFVNTADAGTLADVIYRYGEERHSRRIARAIVQARIEAPITRTAELAEIVAKAVPGKGRGVQRIHPATRTFQAIRIHVNDELAELQSGLTAAEHLLAPGGRLAVVSFHSLEDRIVKQFLKQRGGRSPRTSRHQPDLPSGPAPSFQNEKNLKAGADEIARNPRARSARLRTAVRSAAPAWPAGAT